MTEEIMPRAEKLVHGVSWRGLAGYSLAGLFAVYSLYRTAVFSRIASMSGSLWFPGLMEYIASHEMKRLPECVYFSIGDRESRTKTLICRQYRKYGKIQSLYAGYGIDTFFQLNRGNHYKTPFKERQQYFVDFEQNRAAQYILTSGKNGAMMNKTNT